MKSAQVVVDDTEGELGPAVTMQEKISRWEFELWRRVAFGHKENNKHVVRLRSLISRSTKGDMANG